jgi:glycosyltransferase involved in cell wall biosynthesis
MACGKPIICSTKGATGDILLKSKAGIVVEPGDFKEFSKKILELFNSEDQRRNLGENGIKYIKKNHSLSVFRGNLSVLLDSISK